MSAKLQRLTPNNLLRTEHPRFLWGESAPHLLYANFEFGVTNAKRARSLTKRMYIPGWTEPRTLRYLEKHQEEFRSCLEWLSRGSITDFAEFADLSAVPTDDGGFELGLIVRDMWEQQPEVKFLQQHGLDHGKVSLEPEFQEDSYTSGIQIHVKKPRDPLDLLCGYLLSLLMWDGTVGVRRCSNAGCKRFFRPRTARKKFCSDNCRATAYMDKKSPEAKRDYMRDYRAKRTLLKKARRIKS